MKQKKGFTQKKETISAEDIQLYRLFCILGAAILGFSVFHYIPGAELAKFLNVGRWITLTLLILTAGTYVYIRFVKKPDETHQILTSTGAAYFLIPVLLLLTCYNSMEQPDFKCKVAFGFLSLFAAIYNIYVVKKEFRAITAATLLSVVTLYYASHRFYIEFEIVFSAVCKVLAFLIPLALLIAVWLPKRPKKLKTMVSDRFGAVLCTVMSAVLLIGALILVVVPSVFLSVFIAVLAVYVVIGIVCTIRLI